QELAAAGAKIPSKDKDGKRISSLDDAALDQRIKDTAKAASEMINREAKEGEYRIVVGKMGHKRIDPGPRLAGEMAEIHGRFVALVIEQVARGDSLQSKAFDGGYAPMVIQNWKQLWTNAHQSLQDKIDMTEPAAEKKAD